MSKLILLFVAVMIYIVHSAFAGILSPLFGEAPEDRPKNISPTAVEFEKPRQDSQCQKTFHHHSTGTASWYGPGFHGQTMANGRPYNMHAYTVAHKTLRLGTEVCITNPVNGVSVKATVTDRGPYVGVRIIDLSKRIADELDLTEQGVGRVEISIAPKKKTQST